MLDNRSERRYQEVPYKRNTTQPCLVIWLPNPAKPHELGKSPPLLLTAGVKPLHDPNANCPGCSLPCVHLESPRFTPDCQPTCLRRPHQECMPWGPTSSLTTLATSVQLAGVSMPLSSSSLSTRSPPSRPRLRLWLVRSSSL